jgi:hypothetical protein
MDFIDSLSLSFYHIYFHPACKLDGADAIYIFQMRKLKYTGCL